MAWLKEFPSLGSDELGEIRSTVDGAYYAGQGTEGLWLGLSILLCIVIGYAASWLFPPPAQSLQGLTIHRQDAVAASG